MVTVESEEKLDPVLALSEASDFALPPSVEDTVEIEDYPDLASACSVVSVLVHLVLAGFAEKVVLELLVVSALVVGQPKQPAAAAIVVLEVLLEELENFVVFDHERLLTVEPQAARVLKVAHDLQVVHDQLLRIDLLQTVLVYCMLDMLLKVVFLASDSILLSCLQLSRYVLSSLWQPYSSLA